MLKAKWIGVFFVLFTTLPLGCITSSNLSSNDIKEKNEEEFLEKEINITEVVLDSGDEIEISVWRNDDLNGKYRIDSSGKIFMPLVGVLNVQGVSVFDLREKIIEGLSKYLVDPQVRVKVTSYRSRKVYVLGEVHRPGIFPMEERMSLVEAVAMAGGLTKDANSKSVVLVRNGLRNQDVKVFDMAELLGSGGTSHNIILNSGDIIYVASSFIANVDRFFEHLQTIMWPILTIERGIVLEPTIEEVFGGGGKSGGSDGNRTIVIEN